MSSQNGSITVLHVDDEPKLSELTAARLTKIDDRLSVIPEERVKDGLKRVRETTIDCIVSDYQMPVTDGLEFLKAVRAENLSIPFILFTGQGSEEVAAKAINAGIDAYVQKKLRSGQYSVLAKQITTLVEKHRTEQRLASIERSTHLDTTSAGDQSLEREGSLDTSVSMKIVKEVAEQAGIDPIELKPPLYEVIDPSVLDQLYESVSARGVETYPSVTFKYNGYTVAVNEDLEVSVEN